MIKRILLIVISLLLFMSIFSFSQDIKYEKGRINLMDAVGRVYLLDQKTRLGTAFVGGETFNIFMPAHVGIEDTLLYKPFGSDYFYRIEIKYILNNYDLAIYKRTSGTQTTAFNLGVINKVQLGDRIRYIGWDSDHLASMRESKVETKGVTLNRGEIVDFFDFFGHGIPGYSGAPVINDKDEVVGMVVQGWDFKTLKGNSTKRSLRVFSIDLLRVLEQQVNVSKTKNDTVKTDELRLMDVIDK